MDIIDSFPRFRTHIARMREHGNTFVGHAPDVNDVEAMMNEIERLQEAKRIAGLIADERSKENVALRAALYECANLARGWTDRVAEAPDYLETIYVVACTATGEPVRALEQGES